MNTPSNKLSERDEATWGALVLEVYRGHPDRSPVPPRPRRVYRVASRSLFPDLDSATASLRRSRRVRSPAYLLWVLALSFWSCTGITQPIGTLPVATSTAAQIVHVASSDFNRQVFVVDIQEFRSMRFGTLDGEDQTRIRRGHPERLPMPYLRTAALGLTVPDKLGRMLIIGLGGGAFPAYVQTRLPEVHIDVVEIDPVVARIAQQYFALRTSDTLRLHVMDALDYVRQRAAPYDYILLDAYDADDIPKALLTDAFLDDVRRSLAVGGVVVANVAVSGYFEARRVIKKLTGFYSHCLRMTSTPSYNDVLFLSQRALPSTEELQRWAQEFEPDSEAGLGMHEQIATARKCI